MSERRLQSYVNNKYKNIAQQVEPKPKRRLTLQMDELGFAKAQKLAKEKQVAIATVRADLADFTIAPQLGMKLLPYFAICPQRWELKLSASRNVIEAKRCR
ncbi:MAG: hypothetical protein WCQ26_02680 [Pseudanabaena sp. ELA748]